MSFCCHLVAAFICPGHESEFLHFLLWFILQDVPSSDCGFSFRSLERVACVLILRVVVSADLAVDLAWKGPFLSSLLTILLRPFVVNQRRWRQSPLHL